MDRDTLQQDFKWEDSLYELKGDFKQSLIDQITEEYSEMPTKIQAQTLENYIQPSRQTGKQLFFVQAPGGSGKTLCFTIPAVINALKHYEDKPNHTYETKKVKGKDQKVYRYNPNVVILADTKILIEQIKEDIERCIPADYQEKIKATAMYAGCTSESEFGQFGQILICTPQILQTMVTAKNDIISLDQIRLFIMDEAELIYDSVRDVLQKLLEKIKSNQNIQYIAASATLTSAFKEFAANIFFGTSAQDGLNKSVQISMPLNVEGVLQYCCKLPQGGEKEQTLVFEEIIKLLKEMYLNQKRDTQTMIFLESIEQIDKFNNALNAEQELCHGENKLTFDVIHSKLVTKKNKDGKTVTDQKNNNRQLKRIYQDFRDNKFRLLLCTDIMARGIDIQKVGLVISTFAPRQNNRDSESDINHTTYIHRIARTGRYNKCGVSLLFMRSDDSKFKIKDSVLPTTLPEVLTKKMQIKTINEIKEVQYAGSYVHDVIQSAITAVAKNEENKE